MPEREKLLVGSVGHCDQIAAAGGGGHQMWGIPVGQGLKARAVKELTQGRTEEIEVY